MTQLHKPKRIVTDITGGLLILGALMFGWLPGPGGIPLLLAGLSLLAINHKWARRWMDHIKKYGLNLQNRIFTEHPFWQAFYDVLSVSLVVTAAYLINNYTHNLVLSLGVILLFIGIGIFLSNRRRLSRIQQFIRSKKRKN